MQTGIAEALTGAGRQVALCDAPPTGIAVFDDRVSRYGTLPLLANGRPDGRSLRIEGAEVASDPAGAPEDSAVGEA